MPESVANWQVQFSDGSSFSDHTSEREANEVCRILNLDYQLTGSDAMRVRRTA